jgi:hypothetical protein
MAATSGALSMGVQNLPLADVLVDAGQRCPRRSIATNGAYRCSVAHRTWRCRSAPRMSPPRADRHGDAPTVRGIALRARTRPIVERALDPTMSQNELRVFVPRSRRKNSVGPTRARPLLEGRTYMEISDVWN